MVAACLLSAVAAGCGGVTAADGGDAGVTNADVHVGTGTSSDVQTPSTTTPVEEPVPAHPTGHPVNLVATPEVKKQITAAAESAALEDQRFAHRKIVGPVADTMYYAGWGGYEYAIADFGFASGPQPEIELSGSFVRPVGGNWTAFDFDFHGDIGAYCGFPQRVVRLWLPELVGQNGCGGDGTSVRRTVSNIGFTRRCVATAAGASPTIRCGRFPAVGGTAMASGTLPTNGNGSIDPRPLHLPIYPLGVLPIGIPTTISVTGSVFSCTADLESIACTSPSGSTLTAAEDITLS